MLRKWQHIKVATHRDRNVSSEMECALTCRESRGLLLSAAGRRGRQTKPLYVRAAFNNLACLKKKHRERRETQRHDKYILNVNSWLQETLVLSEMQYGEG